MDEGDALAISDEFIRTCHYMNIITQTICGYSSSLNGNNERPNKTLNNITRAFLMKSSHKEKLWYFAYQYVIYIFHPTESRFCGGFPYLLCDRSRRSYKHIKLWGVRI